MKRLFRLVSPLAGALLCAVMFWILYQELAAHDLRDILRQTEALPWPRLVLALVLVVLAYAVMPGYDLLGMGYINRRLPARRLLPVSLLSYVFSNNVGFFALSGGAVRLRFYLRWGSSTGEVLRL